MSSKPQPPSTNPAARRAFTLHDRLWHENRYVYPVVSRRSKGISIGINLNPDKVCNLDCIYCNVDRTVPPATRTVDLPRLRAELDAMLALVASGAIYRFDPFQGIPAELRRLNDIAFSGDGEPTSYPHLLDALRLATDARTRAFPSGPWPLTSGPSSPPKLILITNATLFHQPRVREALAFLDQHHGEIWAKLDAGTPAYYDLVDRTVVPFQRVLDNILAAAQVRPLVIQSLFLKVHNAAPPTEEIAAYIARLAHIASHCPPGAGIKLVQIYTVARRTTEAYATALSADELAAIATAVTQALPAMAVEVFP